MLVLIIAKYHLLLEINLLCTAYNRIIIAVLFISYFAVLKIHIANKIWSKPNIQTSYLKNKILQMWKLFPRARYLILAK